MASAVRNNIVIVLALAAVGVGIYWSLPGAPRDPEERVRQKIRHNPKDPAAYAELAELLLQRVTALEAAAATAVDAAKATALRNQANQTVDEAIAQYRKALDLAPGNADLNNALAQIYLRQRRFEAAVDLLRVAVKTMPANSPQEAYLRKTYATALIYIHQEDLAEDEIDRVLVLKPDYPEALLDKALCHMLRKEWKEARALIYKALKLQPENPEAHNKLANLYYNTRDYSDALIAIRFAIEHASPADKANYLLTRGQILRKLKRPDDAVATYVEAMRLNPRSVQGLCLLGEAFHDYNLDRSAVTYYRSALGIDPENAEVAGRLAEIFAFSKDENCRDLVSAIEYGERAVKLSREGYIPLLRILAQVYAEALRFQDAINTIEKAESVARQLGRQMEIDELRLGKQAYYYGLGKYPVPPTVAELKAMQSAMTTSAPATDTGPAGELPSVPLPISPLPN